MVGRSGGADAQDVPSPSAPPDPTSSKWGSLGTVPRGEVYDQRWRAMEASGQWPHGEADLVSWFEPETVLDAGCGTGRVAIELHRRGVRAVGVDLDPAMLAVARRKAPQLQWIHADLVDVTVGSPGGRHGQASHGAETSSGAEGTATAPAAFGFDVVVMAGNVMVFVAPGTEADVVANMARHLRPGGHLLAGFQLSRSPLGVNGYEHAAADAGLELAHRWATWERGPYDGGDYAVFAHRAPLRGE